MQMTALAGTTTVWTPSGEQPSYAFLGETWAGGSSYNNSGSNPTLLFMITAANPGGLYRCGITPAFVYTEFPRGMTPTIRPYISLANNGTGLVAAGGFMPIHTGLAFGTYPADTCSPYTSTNPFTVGFS
jgi:hypothetical protein